ncbi:MAG TPA: PAS domain S-box protein, partial [Myxococcota bacterium]|nr:PAS domain S-box protein [Myxococcota bacterium]
MNEKIGSDVELKRFFELTFEMMCIVDSDGRFLLVNAAFERLGYSKAELRERSFTDFVHPDDLAKTQAIFDKLRAGEPTTYFDNRYRIKDGSYRWLQWTGTHEPTTHEIFAVARDVTKLKTSNETLAQANRFLDAMIDNIPHMVFVKEAENLSFVRFNRAGEELLGTSSASLFGKNDHDFFPKEEAEFFQSKDRDTLRSKTLHVIPEEPIQTPGGTRILRTLNVPILDEQGTPRYLLGISEDITARKAGEEARARLAAIVSDSEDGIFSMSLDGKITSWNRSAERMFGYDAKEMLGSTTNTLIPPHRAVEEARTIRRITNGETISPYETSRVGKDGREIDVSVSCSPIRDDSGKLIGVSKITRDISAIKRIQRELTRTKLATEAVNRELESFSYSVAHDLQAPLRGVNRLTEAVLNACGDKLDETHRKHLELVRESAKQMTQSIDAMLALSRMTRSEPRHEIVDLSVIAAAANARLARLEPNRRVLVQIEEDMRVEGDPRLLAIVFDNLLGNAWKFTAKRDEARIDVGSITVDGRRTFFVRDNGAGFDMRNAGKLFGVFQRLHRASEFEGTGVGLATVQRIIHRHGGR